MLGLQSSATWGVRWKQVSPEAREHIMYENFVPVVFRTRREAREWINRKYGYIRRRKDLRVAPYYWRMPSPIPVKVMEV